MVAQVIEGFDTYPVGPSATWVPGTRWNTVAGGLSVQTTNPANGTRSAFKTAGAGSNANTTALIDDNIVSWGGRIYLSVFVAGNQSFGIGVVGATGNLMISIDVGGRVKVKRNGVDLYTSVATVAVANYNYLDAVYNRAAQTIDVYLNNALLTTVAGVATIGALSLASVGAVNGDFVNTSDIYFDDLYWNTGVGSRWGEIAAVILAPTADEPGGQWTPTGVASGFQALDNVPENGAQYIEAANVNDISDFTIPAMPAGVFQVMAIKHYWRGSKTTAGASDVQARLTANAVVSAGANHSMVQGSYTSYEDMYETNPDTGVAWVPGDFVGGNVTIGYERTL